MMVKAPEWVSTHPLVQRSNIDSQAISKLEQFVSSVLEWNRTYNLIARNNAIAQVWFHVLDSLQFLPFIQGERGIDVGSGAGFPGVVLAICLPEVKWCLLDRQHKKARFLQYTVHDLGLNVSVVCDTVQSHYQMCETPLYDIAVVRAVAPLKSLYEWITPLLKNKGMLLTIKGSDWRDELEQMTQEQRDKTAVHMLTHNKHRTNGNNPAALLAVQF